MAFNGTGTFLRIYNWVTDKVNAIPITASRVDGELDGMATGLSNCITKDGQTTITANIPFNSNKITGVGNGTARTDVINVGQVQDNQFQYLGTTGGAADAYTLSPSPTITAYATTQQITAKISATNLTTTPYLQVSAIANPATTAVIKKLSVTKTEIAVEASDLLINGIYHFQRNSANDAWIILNPEKAYFNLTNATKATTTTQGVAYLNNPITIANNATDANNDIDFSAGNFQINDGSGQALATAMTKRLDATWSAGSGNGGLFNGTAVPKAINSTYHCYKIYNPTTGAEDSGFLLGISGTAPDPTSVLPSGYTKFERRGSVLTDGSGNIRAFTQTNNRFEYDSNILDLNATLAGSETSIGVSAPAGLRTRVCMALNIVPSGTGAGVAKVYSHNISTTTVSLSNATAYAGVGLVAGAGYVEATTNLSSQIKINAAATSGSPTLTGTINTSAIIDLTLRF